MISKQKSVLYKQDGFALLITILTVSVIVSVVIAIIDLSRLQLKLAVNSRDAEIAFAAANAGLECAQRVRRVYDEEYISAGRPIPDAFRHCFNAFFEIPALELDEGVHFYSQDVTWGTGASTRCSTVGFLSVISSDDNATIVVNNIVKAYIPNYNKTTDFTCPTNAECTIAVATGYNVPCAQKNNPGVLKREVLVEF
jgi:hypothetical protein